MTFVMHTSIMLLLAATSAPDMATGKTILLWPEGAPGAVGTEAKDIPKIDFYPASPRYNSGAAIIVCPGGGYGGLASDFEGRDVAEWFAAQGVNGFVLTYRHAPDYRHPVPLGDAQRAIRTVRARAAEWKIDPGRIGMLGFSAGGHLTATAGTQFDDGKKDAPDVIDQNSSRPDFIVLVYPVISTTESYSHVGSRNNLLGPDASPELIRSVSAEKNVTASTPPAFLVASWADDGVPAQNSLAFFTAMKAAGVPAEMHVYEKGPHGFGLGVDNPVLSQWPAQCLAWLRTRGVLKYKE